MESLLWSCGHTCTDLGIPIAGKVEEKEKTEKLVKVGQMVDREIFTYLKKLETANFNSLQKVQDFRFLNETVL